jgi:hypothetical protein
MKKSLSFFAISIILLFISSEAISQETRILSINEFSKISLNISADVYIEQGSSQKVVAEGSQRLIDLLETEVSGGKWSIEYSERNVKINNEKLKITITVVNIEAVKVNSSGDIHGSGTFKADEFSVGINGSGDVSLNLDVRELDLSVNGSGDMHLSGKANEVDASINGSGDINADDLNCNEAEVGINGSGDVSIHVSERLEAHVNGSGDVRYSGDPDIKVRSYGSGDVKQK